MISVRFGALGESSWGLTIRSASDPKQTLRYPEYSAPTREAPRDRLPSPLAPSSRSGSVFLILGTDCRLAGSAGGIFPHFSITGLGPFAGGNVGQQLVGILISVRLGLLRPFLCLGIVLLDAPTGEVKFGEL